MLISLNWLKNYIEIKENIEELTHTLTMIGQEVESIKIEGEGLENVVIGQIIELEKHPNSSKLTVLKVKISEEEILNIVCGASNHRVNDKVVVAKIGAILPGDFKIKKNKIRDVESEGMLCSEIELALGEDADGIIILPEDAPIGEEYRKYIKADDVIFELEITPNRPDCLCYIGIAREIAAYYGRKVKYPSISVNDVIEMTNQYINVDLEDKNRCGRYVGRVVKNIKVEESPEWLQIKLRSIGLKPINNIVDITNFIMFEYNQPMHAFDLDKIKDKKIIIRKAEDGEKIVTLEGETKELKNGELIIADSENPIAIAGIIGGKDTQIDENTKNIFLEAAYFTPENIRKTSRNLGIFTDSSYRNERGLDIDGVLIASNRAVSLISEITKGEVLGTPIDRYPVKSKKKEIQLDLEKLNKFVGKNITSDEVGKILSNLNIEINSLSDKRISLIPPNYRGDLLETEDIYEEIIRMYGFENIEPTVIKSGISSGKEDKKITLMSKAKKILSTSGLNEVINYSFITKNIKDYINIEKEMIFIKNPLNEDMSVMRTNLMYSLLSNIRDNINRNQYNLKLFEVSKVFSLNAENYQEDISVGIAISGRKEKNLWETGKNEYNFFTLKGYVEEFLKNLGVKKFSIDRSKDVNYHPGRSADIFIGKDKIGTFGEMHVNVLQKMDIRKERVFYAELNLDMINKYISSKLKYEKISKYPEVLRDLAVVLDKDLLVGNMIQEIKNKFDLIEYINIFDIYLGENIGKDKKSVAINIVLRDKNKTLVDSEIEKTIKKILAFIQEKYQGEIRQ